MIRIISIYLCAVFVVNTSIAQKTESGQDQSVHNTKYQPKNYYGLPINIQHFEKPQVVSGSDGKNYVSYHLLITNLSHVDLTLKSVSVKDNNNWVIEAYDEKDLQDNYRFRSTLIPDKTRSRTIESGDTGMLFFWLTANLHGLPKEYLVHDFVFEANENILIWNKPITGDIVLDNYLIGLSHKKPRVFSAPVKGKNWRAGNGPGYKTSHQFVLTGAGETRIPQRYAIDFQIVDEKGIILPTPLPDELTNEMFYGYGQHVYAVADGIVVSVKDGIPENVPQANGAIITDYEMDGGSVSGNDIVLKIGEDEYVHYAHLIPGSIKVKEGDKIKTGMVIGQLGNSGNSVGPHLHFNFTDGVNPNYSHGLPYVFDLFVDSSGRKHIGQIPLLGEIISF